MDDSKKKINFDRNLLYYSNTNENDDEEIIKVPNMNKETYNSTNRKHACSLCGKRFFTNNSLNVHMEHHNPEEGTNTNDKEDNWKDRRMLKKGINCNKLECNFMALDAVEYRKHLAQCRGERVIKNDSSAFCEKCENYFSSKDHLNAHRILCHPDNCPENYSDISLKATNSTKQTVSDPVCLYISESENGMKNSRSMYPESSVMKRKVKECDIDLSPESYKSISLPFEDQIQSNITVEKINNSDTISGESYFPNNSEKATAETKNNLLSMLGNNGYTNDIEHGNTLNIISENENNEESTSNTYKGVKKMMCELFEERGVLYGEDNNDSEIREKSDELFSVPDEDVMSRVKEETSIESLISDVFSTSDGKVLVSDTKPKESQQYVKSREVLFAKNKEDYSFNLKESTLYKSIKTGNKVSTTKKEDMTRAKEKELHELIAKKLDDFLKNNLHYKQQSKYKTVPKKSSKLHNIKNSRVDKNLKKRNKEKKYQSNEEKLPPKFNKGSQRKENPAKKSMIKKTIDEINANNLYVEKSINKNVKRKQKRQKISAVSESLTLKDRSVRARKKLILPDFEYGYDAKCEKEEASKRDAVVEKQSITPDNPVRKRGRPRKYLLEKIEVINSAPDIKKEEQQKDVRLNKHSPAQIQKSPVIKQQERKPSAEVTAKVEVQEEEPKEFSLMATISEQDIDDSGIPKDGGSTSEPIDLDESWLKKIDFSDQSVLDTWQDPPFRKKGRPRKRKLPQGIIQTPVLDKDKNATSSAKTGSDANENRTSIPYVTPLKRKRGRPPKHHSEKKLSDSVTIEVIQVSHVESENTLNADISAIAQLDRLEGTNAPMEVDRTSSVGSSTLKDVECNTNNSESLPLVKKRGRPRKIIEKVKIKKRGRPPKVVINNENVAIVGIVQKAHDKIETPEHPDNDKIEKKSHLDKKREFLQYIRIQDQLDSSASKSVEKREDFQSTIGTRRRGRRPKNERFTNTNTSNIERPYSIYNKFKVSSANMYKRRTAPLCTFDLLKIKQKVKIRYSEALSTKPNDSANHSENDDVEELPKTSNGNLTSARINYEKCIVKSENVEKKSKRGRKSLKDSLISTNKKDSPTLDMKDDETKNIDPDLYLADIRNRAKYVRIFRKLTEIPKHDEYFPDSLITCGRCKKLMTLRHYYLNHQMSHYYICWLEGEKEIDLSEDQALIRIMQYHVNPEAVRKKYVRLNCEKCEKVVKSVVGYVSHVRFCSRINEIDYLGTCVICGKRLKPSSLRHHYVKNHDIPNPNVSAKTPEQLIPDAPFSRAAIREVLMKSAKKNHRQGFERKGIERSVILEDEQFWTSLKTSYDLFMCMGLSCRHMTLSKDDLKTHIKNCPSFFCEFSCFDCPFKTKYESEIIYHCKNKCKDSSDTEDNKTDDLNDSRRVSTRVKKLRYKYDEEFFDENEMKKMEDDDFVITDDECNESTEDDGESSKEFHSKPPVDDSKGSKVGLRHAFHNHSSSRTQDPLNWAVELRLKTSRASPALEYLKPDINQWEMFPITRLPKNIPQQFKSMKLTFDGKTFIEYNLFHSDVVKGVPISYTGGPVWAMSWVPLPSQVTEQYLAVAGLKHMNHVLEISSTSEYASLIQLWKYSSLDNISNTIDNPTLALAIAHKFGTVWSVEWCPSGGYYASMNPARLGIIALATSSGCVPVYSVPKIDSSGDSRNIFVNPEPDLVLRNKSDNVQCTRIVWLKNPLRSIICGGFSNGIIVLWDLTTASSLLKRGNEIYPYRTFEAHNAAIVALDAHWIENGRYLITSSIDRVMKYWDLEDLSGPMHELEKTSPISSLKWLHQWAVDAIALDCNNLFEPPVIFHNPRDTVEKKKTICNLKDTYWSIAYSEWNDMVAISSYGGLVKAVAAKRLSSMTFKQPDFEKMITETNLQPLADESQNENESIEARTGIPSTKGMFDCSSVIQNRALKFCDRVTSNTSTDKYNYEPDGNSVLSINSLCWNQNFNSFNWLAAGYECGVVRVFRVERFDKLRLTKFYKLNENNDVKFI